MKPAVQAKVITEQNLLFAAVSRMMMHDRYARAGIPVQSE
jgi:hypothetical protein